MRSRVPGEWSEAERDPGPSGRSAKPIIGARSCVSSCLRSSGQQQFPPRRRCSIITTNNNIGKEAHMTTQGLLAGSVAATLSLAAVPTGAQERSLDEIKKEVMRRAGHINPFEGIRREDAEQIVAALASLDRDHRA